MARNGSGVYSAPGSDFPAVSGTVISSTKYNNVVLDIAAEITNSIAADGQTTITAHIPLSGFRLTGVGSGSALGDAATIKQIAEQKGVYSGTVGGTADVITLTPSPAITGYSAGNRFSFIASGANTTNVTIAVSGLAAKAVTKKGAVALVAGDIASGELVTIQYDGTRFQLIPTGGKGAELGTANTWTAAQIFTATQTLSAAVPLLIQLESDAAANEQKWRYRVNSGIWSLQVADDAETGTANALAITRGTGAVVSSVAVGNTTDNPAFTMSVDGTQRNVGFREIPQNVQNGNYTAVLSDNGKHIYKASGGAGETITIPANASVAYPVGTALTFINQGGGALSIAVASDTMTLAGVGTTGTRSLSDDGVSTAIKVAATEWIISGTGLS